MTLATIPTLETDRLVLRGFTADDFDDYYAVRSAQENAKWLSASQSKGAVWRHMCETIGQWTLRGYGRFCVRTKANNAMVGIIGALHPFEYTDPEIAYAVHPSQKRKGYATEAVQACLTWGYQKLGWPTAISTIDPDNTASQAVAQKLGATRTGDFQKSDDFTLEIWRYPPAEEFLKQKH